MAKDTTTRQVASIGFVFFGRKRCDFCVRGERERERALFGSV